MSTLNDVLPCADHLSGLFTFNRTATISRPEPVYNVVPGDFTHDGMLDLLIMGAGSTAPTLLMTLYPGIGGGYVGEKSQRRPEIQIS